LGLSFYLARDVAVGSDAGVAVGDEPEVHGFDEPVLEDPREAVHHEPRAVGAQRLVVELQGDLLRALHGRRRPRQEGAAGGEEEERDRQEETPGAGSNHAAREASACCRSAKCFLFPWLFLVLTPIGGERQASVVEQNK
jgi:hypothetical protein